MLLLVCGSKFHDVSLASTFFSSKIDMCIGRCHADRMTSQPTPSQLAAAQLAMDLNRAALNGDLSSLEQLLPEATALDRVEAASLACESRHTAVAERLLNVDTESVPAQTMNATLSMAARAGMVGLIRNLLEQREDLDKEATLISALLMKQGEVIAFLAPKAQLSVVVEDIEDNFDDSYKLSHEQMAATLDQLAAFLTPHQRASLEETLGSYLLPLTVACTHAQRRAKAAGKLSATGSSRSRPRH